MEKIKVSFSNFDAATQDVAGSSVKFITVELQRDDAETLASIGQFAQRVLVEGGELLIQIADQRKLPELCRATMGALKFNGIIIIKLPHPNLKYLDRGVLSSKETVLSYIKGERSTVEHEIVDSLDSITLTAINGDIVINVVD